MHREQIDCAAIRIVGARHLALQRETARQRVDSRALLAAVEVTERRERLSGAIDGPVRIPFKGREPGLTDSQHAQVGGLRIRAQETLRGLELISSGLDGGLA